MSASAPSQKAGVDGSPVPSIPAPDPDDVIVDAEVIDDDVDVDRLDKPTLVQRLTDAGLPTNGNESVLRQRLRDHLARPAAIEPEPTVPALDPALVELLGFMPGDPEIAVIVACADDVASANEVARKIIEGDLTIAYDADGAASVVPSPKSDAADAERRRERAEQVAAEAGTSVSKAQQIAERHAYKAADDVKLTAAGGAE